MENKDLHLQMIQGVVNRLSQISILLKGWSVFFISALLVLATKNLNIVYIACIPAVIFWRLDGLFLRQERLFRALFNFVRTKETSLDFSMDTAIVESQVDSWLKVTLSKTLVAFHGTIVATIFLVGFFI